VFDADELLIRKEAGPEIFVQSHSLIIPSGSLEAEPSKKMLSVGKVITWSGPTRATGGLLFSLHLSQNFSFLHENNISIPANAITNTGKKIFFISKV